MSIVAEKMKEKIEMIKKYQSDNHLDFSLSISDATDEQLKNGTVPIFEANNEKMGKTKFFEMIKKVENKTFEKKTDNEYLVKGKINVGYNGDKWNPQPIYENYGLTFKCWNYSF